MWTCILITLATLPLRQAFVSPKVASRRPFGPLCAGMEAEAEAEAGVEAGVEAFISLIDDLPEDDVPEVRLTRSRDGSTGTASFTFRRPLVLRELKRLLVDEQRTMQCMRMVDSEGVIECEDIQALFEQGKPEAVVATYIMRSEDEWDRLMRFMDRYANAAGLTFTSEKDKGEG